MNAAQQTASEPATEVRGALEQPLRPMPAAERSAADEDARATVGTPTAGDPGASPGGAVRARSEDSRKLRIIDASGRVVVGHVQGLGGVASLETVRVAARRAAAGKALRLVAEDAPGHARVYVQFSARANGPTALVDLRNAHVEVES